METRAANGRGLGSARRRRVRATGLWWRADFDGHEVTVARRWLGVRGLRTRRFRLAEVICAHVSWVGSEGEVVQFDLHLHGGRSVGAGRQMGLRRKGPWYDLAWTIQQAVLVREVHVLRTTVGLGPWGEEEWARVEALVPEITAFDTCTYTNDYFPAPVEVSHRDGVASLLSRLADPRKPQLLNGGDIVLAGHDIPTTSPGRDGKIRRRCDAWAALLERLQNGTEVTDTPQWAAQAEAIVAAAYAPPTTDPIGVEWRLDTPR
ncbi:hypothetical protein RKE30_32335 [Streptomyces sp. Li-HN-5-11]|uniref:hypothetical protein n=1 Tax=Streptomyces sp. Li-HN-5-11 TaxID=3075432 RepID=UPI0028AE9781|nr:hypothetical protein [Streptomyces sp. Li-HN-5-11]WNM34728.1 hypothetical protein RKE30_32335 [Streptomyces sp. Li-HN-5-11]